MNPVMFLVGGIIFAAFLYFLIWNIFTNHKKNKEENYPNYYSRHGGPDSMDYDGMGNFGRSSTDPDIKMRKVKTAPKKSKKKVAK